MLFEKYRNGINIGGYLSQYEIITPIDKESLNKHFETFITEMDIKRIASWGYDHVRIPMEGMYFYVPETGRLREDALKYLHRTVEYCENAGLNVILDLHNIYGHKFGAMSVPSELMTSEVYQSYFVDFWRLMEKEFHGEYKITVMFELFNEIADATGYQWNKMVKAAVSEIRLMNPERWILVGSNNVNSIQYLDRLVLFDDPFVFYNFHYYEPNVFTHQKAHFSEEFRTYCHDLTYPGDITEYLAFLEENPQYKVEHILTKEDTANDFALMKKYFKSAEDFIHYTGKELMCSEFGVIDSADESEAIKWIHDFTNLCESMKIGHSMWNYKELDFELVNIDGEIVRPKLLAALL